MMKVQVSDVILFDGIMFDKIEILLVLFYKLFEIWGGVWDDIFQLENCKYSGVGNGWIKILCIIGELFEMFYLFDFEKVFCDVGLFGSIKGVGEIFVKDDVSVIVWCYFFVWEVLLF